MEISAPITARAPFLRNRSIVSALKLGKTWADSHILRKINGRVRIFDRLIPAPRFLMCLISNYPAANKYCMSQAVQRNKS